MLWMITDFSKDENYKASISHIKLCLESGVDKVSLRNINIYPRNIVHEIKTMLDENFPQKNIFIHDPDEDEIIKFDFLHFTSKKIDEAVFWKKKCPNKKIAISTHCREEYEKTFDNGIDFAFLSPVFKPLSKQNDTRKTVSPINVKNLYLLGGIDKMKAFSLIEKGFVDFAGISLFYGDNVYANIKELLIKISEKKL